MLFVQAVSARAERSRITRVLVFVFERPARTAAGRVTIVPTRRGKPFGVAVGDTGVWVATDRAVVRVDPARNVVTAAGAIPPQAITGFAQVAVGAGAVWVAGYDTDALYRITP